MVIDTSRTVRAFFVEDDIEDFELFRDSAAAISSNIQLVHLSSCEFLLQRLEEEVPDLIFLDFNLGKINGLECLQILSQRAELASIPKIIMSTLASNSTIEMSFEYGANHFLTKPNSYRAIEEELRKILLKDW